jgi:hypothetical protein
MEKEVMSIEEETKEMIKKHAALIYKTTSSVIGKTASETSAPRFGHSTKFTKPLAYSGMYKYEGLNTVVEKERYVDGCKDWMEKIN